MTDTNDEPDTPTCPHCGSHDVLPILYGYPGPEMLRAKAEGRVLLGGCGLRNGAPLQACRTCRRKFDPLRLAIREQTEAERAEARRAFEEFRERLSRRLRDRPTPGQPGV